MNAPSDRAGAAGPGHVALLCRSQEQNGISYHCDTLVGLDPARFVRLRSVAGARRHLAEQGARVRAIFALSDIEYIVADYLCRSLGLKIPILLGVFHPRQWESTLDGQTGAHRARVFRQLLRGMPAGNVLASSRETIQRCERLQPQLRGGMHLLLGPLREYPRPERKRPTGTMKIGTVGRLVDFKVCTILALAEVVAGLRRSGVALEYHIYGEGPSREDLVAGIAALNVEGCLQLHEPFPTAEFAQVVASHDVFFGMGGAVVQAAMLGVPALIAIQGERRPVSYGWFCDFDHRDNPMFGDPHPGVEPQGLDALLHAWLNVPDAERESLGERCRQATQVFGGRAAAETILAIADAAQPNPSSGVTIWDLIVMRVESYWIRWTQRKGFHT